MLMGSSMVALLGFLTTAAAEAPLTQILDDDGDESDVAFCGGVRRRASCKN
jgi:hypothetical protein